MELRGFCVGVDIVILPCNKPKNKMTISPPAPLIFGTAIDIVKIFDHTKNQVGGLSVGRLRLPFVKLCTPNNQKVTKTKKQGTL